MGPVDAELNAQDRGRGAALYRGTPSTLEFSSFSGPILKWPGAGEGVVGEGVVGEVVGQV